MVPGTRILVADDDPDLLDAVAETLELLGALVVRANSGDALIGALADEGPFALVVTDISMPWMSGLQVMHSARYAGLGTPIVVMTANRDPQTARDVRALGAAVRLLYKPFGLAELESAIDALLPTFQAIEQRA